MSGIKSKLSDNDDLFKLLSFPTMWCHDTTVDTGVRIKYANMLGIIQILRYKTTHVY